MKLIIAEIPSVTKSIALALGGTFRADGYFEKMGISSPGALGIWWNRQTRLPTMTAIKSGGIRAFLSCPTPSAMWRPPVLHSLLPNGAPRCSGVDKRHGGICPLRSDPPRDGKGGCPCTTCRGRAQYPPAGLLQVAVWRQDLSCTRWSWLI